MFSDVYPYLGEYSRSLYDQGYAYGLAKGFAKGRLKGERRAILLILEARKIPVSEQDRERVRSCTDPDVLDAWIKRLAYVSSAEELFA